MFLKLNSKSILNLCRSQDQICSSDSPNIFSEFFFPNSVLLCSFLGLWSGFINPPLQSLVNQYFSQTFERLFSRKKTLQEKPPRLRCINAEKLRNKSLKWVVSISRDYWIYFDITWKSSKKSEFWGKRFKNQDFFLEQIWSCDRR